MKKRIILAIITLTLIAALIAVLPMLKSKAPSGEGTSADTNDRLEYWSEDSAVMKSIITYVASATDKNSDGFVAPEDRIAVFDFDGTLYGELFPTYFDTCLFIHRALHDKSFNAPEDIKEYAQELEDALYNYLPEPDSDKSTAQCAAELFKGMTLDEYREYVDDFMKTPAYGFENMTYGEGFYLPMVELVRYLSEHDFTVFISSGSERTMVRRLISGTLDNWIPSYQVIGSTFSLEATGQGDKAGKSYSYSADDEVLMEGNLVIKNQKTNKVFSIVDEIGKAPVLVFGNSSGDLAMAQYALQNGGKAYMLLCDDTVRDYGDTGKAASFAEDCAKLGMETISMKDDFETIYKKDAVKAEAADEDDADEELKPAA